MSVPGHRSAHCSTLEKHDFERKAIRKKEEKSGAILT
jgi:hypothetical protein